MNGFLPNKRLGIVGLVVALILIVAVYLMKDSRDFVAGTSLEKLVREHGKPMFIAKWTEVEVRKLKVLRLVVLGQDPEAVQDWNTVTNVMVVWGNTGEAKRNARYFYDEMTNDPGFDGTAWYSSRSFFGEKVVVVKIDNTGRALETQRMRINAIALQLINFARRSEAAKK